MKALVQRVRGSARIDIEQHGQRSTDSFDGVGLVVLLGWLAADVERTDLVAAEEWVLNHVVGLRIFEDAGNKMNLSLADYARANVVPSGILWVSQFTLGAELSSGFRPSFTRALDPAAAAIRYARFREQARQSGPHANIFGEFGAAMQLTFTNWGPVTILLER